MYLSAGPVALPVWGPGLGTSSTPASRSPAWRGAHPRGSPCQQSPPTRNTRIMVRDVCRQACVDAMTGMCPFCACSRRAPANTGPAPGPLGVGAADPPSYTRTPGPGMLCYPCTHIIQPL